MSVSSPITGQLNAHYLLIFKGNQPLAYQAAQALLTGTDDELADSTTIEDDQGHARTERRTLRTAPADDTLFPGARQVLRLRRDVGGLDGTRTSKEIIHAVTSLPSGLASPEHLNHYIRQHWCMENRLHWIRDVAAPASTRTPSSGAGRASVGRRGRRYGRTPIGVTGW